MINFVYTRLEAAYSPHGVDGWQVIGDEVTPAVANMIEEHVMPPRDRNSVFGTIVGDTVIFGNSSIVGSGGSMYTAVHDASGRSGVFIAHGLVMPYGELRRRFGGDWREVCRDAPWITSTTALIQTFGLGDGRVPEPEPWMRRPRQ